MASGAVPGVWIEIQGGVVEAVFPSCAGRGHHHHPQLDRFSTLRTRRFYSQCASPLESGAARIDVQRGVRAGPSLRSYGERHHIHAIAIRRP